MAITFEVLKDETGPALERVARAAGDMSPVMREISEIFYDQTMENFEQEGRPAWEALAPATIAERTRRGYWPGKILQRSGELKSAVHPFSSNDEAGVAVAKPYAAIQQLGGLAGRGHAAEIPARPYLPLEPGTLDQLQAETADNVILALNTYLLEAWEG